MRIELTPEQKSARSAFRDFASRHVAPRAGDFDREERLPPDLLGEMGRRGYWGTFIPKEYGGGGLDMISYGLLNEEIGRACSSVRSLLTVHGMVSLALMKWGGKALKDHWLPRLADGRALAAFGLTEANVGSDAAGVESTAERAGESFRISGRKKWVTGGQLADIFLVFARCEGKPTAFLVERDSPGLTVEPVSGMLGVRASMLAELRLEECRVPRENVVGGVGFGFSHVGSHALDCGRYSVAWGCVGIIQGCVEVCLEHAGRRRQFGALLKDHQLIQQMMTEMLTSARAARLLCYHAGYLKDVGDPGSIMETSVAKYFASRAAAAAASEAVQIHGAAGCAEGHPAQRFYRDAKVMEIIEGSTQIQQIAIAKLGAFDDGPRP